MTKFAKKPNGGKRHEGGNSFFPLQPTINPPGMHPYKNSAFWLIIFISKGGKKSPIDFFNGQYLLIRGLKNLSV